MKNKNLLIHKEDKQKSLLEYHKNKINNQILFQLSDNQKKIYIADRKCNISEEDVEVLIYG